jgi:hypothetical protein
MLTVISLGLVSHYLLWQFAEPWLFSVAESVLARLRGRPAHRTQRFDANGIPVQLYHDGGLQYNPLFIAARARRDFERRQDPERLSSFLRLSDWLAAAAVDRDGALFFPYRFDLPEFGLKAPWFSALAQGVAISVFAQRHALERDPVWLDRYRKALASLEPGKGLAEEGPDGSLWFLEYPSEQAPHVLNGMMGVLLELHRAGGIVPDTLASDLFERGFKGLLARLPGFDRRGFSHYSLGGRPASRNYHRMHIRQLRELNLIHPDPLLKAYARRWARHDLLPVAVQLFYNPRPKRVLLFLLTLAGIMGAFLIAGYLSF